MRDAYTSSGPLFALPAVSAHAPTKGEYTNILSYNSLLLHGIYVSTKGLNSVSSISEAVS